MTITETSATIPRHQRATRRTTDIDLVIARRLRAFMRLQGASHEAVGAHVGLTWQQISKYANGQNRISIGKLVQIAAYLRLPLAAFFEGLEGEAPNTSMPEEFTDAALRAARNIMRLPDERNQIEVGKVCARMVEIFEEIGRKHDEGEH